MSCRLLVLSLPWRPSCPYTGEGEEKLCMLSMCVSRSIKRERRLRWLHNKIADWIHVACCSTAVSQQPSRTRTPVSHSLLIGVERVRNLQGTRLVSHRPLRVFYRYASVFRSLPPLLESVAGEQPLFYGRYEIDDGDVPVTRAEMVEVLLETARQVRQTACGDTIVPHRGTTPLLPRFLARLISRAGVHP